MATMTFINNTHLPIHVATEWDTIVQEFKNDILRGQTVNLPAAGFGWQDVLMVQGFIANRISHAQDWIAALSLGTTIAGAAATIASVGLTVISAGAAAPLVVASAEATAGAAASTMTAAAAAAAAGTATTVSAGTVGGAVLTGVGLVATFASFAVRPVTVSGLWGPDGYTFVVSGGDIHGNFDENNQFNVTSISPLVVRWTNKVSHLTGSVGATR